MVIYTVGLYETPFPCAIRSNPNEFRARARTFQQVWIHAQFTCVARYGNYSDESRKISRSSVSSAVSLVEHVGLEERREGDIEEPQAVHGGNSGAYVCVVEEGVQHKACGDGQYDAGEENHPRQHRPEPRTPIKESGGPGSGTQAADTPAEGATVPRTTRRGESNECA